MSYLWYDGDAWPQVTEPNFSDVNTVDLDVASGRLDDPEEGHGQGGLPRPCPSHDTHLGV